MKLIIYSLPNWLTLSRIAAIPLIVLALFVHNSLGDWCATIMFIGACVTDFFDGYIAREWQATSDMGKFLDPVADKLLVASTLLMLAGFQRIQDYHLIPALIILCREILVSGLRDFVSETRLQVTFLAKCKTFIQMFSLSCLLGASSLEYRNLWHNLGLATLWFGALLTLISGYGYVRHGWQYILKNQKDS